MNHANSGLAHSTNGSPQLTLENGEMAAKARENEAKVAELYKYDHNEVIRAINANDMEYLRTKLSRFSPIPILSTAQIKPEHKKNGYEQVKYEWINEEYTYISRWHTHTPNAPEYSHDTWVVERNVLVLVQGEIIDLKFMRYWLERIGGLIGEYGMTP